MKNDQKPPMTARQNTLRPTPFTVNPMEETAPQPDTDALMSEVSAEEAELAQQQAIMQARQQEIIAKRQAVEAAARQEKVDQRAALLEDAEDWRDISRTSADPERSKEFLRKARAAEAEATRLAVELNLVVDPTTEPEAKPAPKPMSTGNAIWLIVGLFLFCLVATYIVGKPIASDPMNSIGQSMLVNAPLRALLAFTLTFATFLVAVFFIRFCFPQFYRIWHNRVDSERSLESLIHEAPAWVVLACLLALFYTFMQVFASYYQALYA